MWPLPQIPTVAIIDDDEAVREALGDLLHVSGLICRCFATAGAFLAALRTTHFDCIVTDVRMEGMSGIELLERLQKDRCDLPIIVLSSILDQQVRARALGLGAHCWLSKPVGDKRLLDALSAAMGSGSVAAGEGHSS